MRYASFKLTFFISFLALFAAKADAQSLQGFYTGELKISGRNARLSLQLDLMETNGIYNAVLRSRIFEDGVLWQ